MVVFCLILAAFAFILIGILLANILESDLYIAEFIVCLFGVLIGGGFFKCAIDYVKEEVVIEALNNTLQYDTVSLDKNGKILKIEFK